MDTRKSTQEPATREAKSESGRQERMSWGPRVKAARERLGLTQADLAEAAGVAVGTVQNIEGGKTTPQKAKLAPVLEFLGLDRKHTELWSDDQWYVAEMAVAMYDQVPVKRQPEAASRMAAILADLIVEEAIAEASATIHAFPSRGGDSGTTVSGPQVIAAMDDYAGEDMVAEMEGHEEQS